MLSSRDSFIIWTCLLVVVPIGVSTTTDEEGSLFYSTGSAIYEVGLKSQKKNAFVADPSHRYVGVAVTAHPNVIYWSTMNVTEKTIMRSMDDYFTKEIIVNRGLVAPEHLAVDWITGNVYFIDTYKKHIGACTKNGSHCTVIMDNAAMLDSPGGFVLNSARGELFWTDYGKNPVIWRVKMNGKHTYPIVGDVGWPKDLAIDYLDERLYWIDSKYMTIESVAFDGTDRKVFANLTGTEPRSIAIFDDQVYWSDMKTRTIRSINIVDGDDHKIIVKESGFIYNMDIYHSSLKPRLQNPCDNHGCSEICLISGNLDYSCACKLGSSMNEVTETCIPQKKSHHLVIAGGDKILHYHHHEILIGKPLIEEILTPIRMSQIAYDRGSKDLLVDDQFTNSIFSFNTTNNELRRIATIDGDGIGDIRFTDRKKMIEWTVPNRRRIDRRIRLYESTTIRHRLFDDEPQELLNIPESNESFIVFKSDNKGLHLDWLKSEKPYERMTLIEKLIGPKISLAYDEYSKKVYFADEGAQIIKSFSSNVSESRHVQKALLCSGIEKPVSLAISNGKLFWTVRNSRVLQWANIHAGYQEARSMTLPVDNSVGIMDILAFDTVTAQV